MIVPGSHLPGHRVPSLTSHRLSVITRQADVELALIQGIVDDALAVDGRGDLEALFGDLLAKGRGIAPRTLDLIGHSTPGSSLLQLGDFVIDARSSRVTAFFRELAEQEVLPRLGVYALRLLGSKTGETDEGRQTICALASILGVEVYGALGPVYAGYYDARGFRDDARYVLRCATDMRGDPSNPPLPRAPRSPRALDLDALPHVALEAASPWPRVIATADASRELLQLIRRADGKLMPGLLAQPTCEVALPGDQPSAYRVAQIMLDYELVRVYPDGPGGPSIVYPVSDPYALYGLVERLQVVQPAPAGAS